MPLEKQYAWLLKESGPRMVKNALALIDTMERPGKANNPVIMDWAKEVNNKISEIYLSDEIPWCGLFMAVVAKRSYKEIPKDPLWALNWGTFGHHVATPMLGDVLVFVRKTTNGKKAGHVGLYVGEDATCYHVLGGNQSDKVSIVRKEKIRLYTSRRPDYQIQPNNIRKIVLNNSATISNSEQ